MSPRRRDIVLGAAGVAMAASVAVGVMYQPAPAPVRRPADGVLVAAVSERGVSLRPRSWSVVERTHAGRPLVALAGLSSGTYRLRVEQLGRYGRARATVRPTSSVNRRAVGRSVLLRYADGVPAVEGERALQITPYRPGEETPAVPGVYLVLADWTSH